MDKGKLNYFIDIGLLISFLLMFFTGLFKWPGWRSFYSFITDWGLVSRIHNWSGLVMGLLVFVHLALHWKWIVAMTRKVFTKKNRDTE